MSQPVKLSDALVLDARIAGEVQERSIAGQVEFWAQLGRSVEQLLNGRQVMALRRGSDTTPLSETLASVDTPDGRKRVADVLAHRPFPHFAPNPGTPGVLIRTAEDGTQTLGRFVNRVFTPEAAPLAVPSKRAPKKAPARPAARKAKPRGLRQSESWA